VLLPAGPAADVTRPIEDLSRRLREVVAEDQIDRVRDTIMEHGVPVDEVGCDPCGSADFSNEGCEACNAVRSDGTCLARRRAGWKV
jgi:hypothetical protein